MFSSGKGMGVVPALSGSKGLPSKNLLDIAGRSTLKRPIHFGFEREGERLLGSTGSAQPVALDSLGGGILP